MSDEEVVEPEACDLFGEPLEADQFVPVKPEPYRPVYMVIQFSLDYRNVFHTFCI